MTTKDFYKEAEKTTGWKLYKEWLFKQPEYEHYLWEWHPLKKNCKWVSFIKDTPLEIIEGSLRRFILEHGFEFVGTCPHRVFSGDIFGKDELGGYMGIYESDKRDNKTDIYKTDTEAMMSICLECLKEIK